MKIKNNMNIIASIIAILSIVLMSAFNVSAAQSAVDLGTAGDYVILAKSGISTTGTTAVTGNIGVSPIDSTAITGFSLILDSSNVYATSSILTGKIYAADYALPTPSNLNTAIGDMETAYTDAAGRTETGIVTELGAGDISGMTLAPGLYKWGSGVLINNGVTLSGSSNDVWIFQIAQDLTVGNGAIITLSNGAQAKNVFWQVAGQTTLGTTSQFKGVILSKTLIEMQTGATLDGRALAQTAVTLDASTITSASASNPVEQPVDAVSCTPDWNCSSWTACGPSMVQTRTCDDSENCNTNTDKPMTNRACTYTAPVEQETETPVNNAETTTDGENTTTPIVDETTETTTEPTTPQTTNTNTATDNNSGNEAKKTSWWMIGLIVGLIAGLVIGGYYYFKSRK